MLAESRLGCNPLAALDELDSCRWDLRGWEHDFLFTRINRKFRRPKFGSHIGSAELSPEGDRIIVASAENVSVWDVWEDRRILSFEGQPRFETRCIAFDPTGSRVASGHRGAVYLWDALTGEQFATFEHKRSSAAWRLRRMELESSPRQAGTQSSGTSHLG